MDGCSLMPNQKWSEWKGGGQDTVLKEGNREKKAEVIYRRSGLKIGGHMSYFYTAETLSLHSVMLGILSKLQSHFFGHYPELVSIGEGKGIESLVNHQICFPLSGFSSPQHPTVESDVMQILFIPRFPPHSLVHKILIYLNFTSNLSLTRTSNHSPWLQNWRC